MDNDKKMLKLSDDELDQVSGGDMDNNAEKEFIVSSEKTPSDISRLWDESLFCIFLT